MTVKSKERLTLPIEGMICASCVVHLEKAVSKVDGVTSAGVNLAMERATVEYLPAITGIAEMRYAVEDAGYEVARATGDQYDYASTRKDVSVLRNKSLFSLAVAAVIMSLMFVPAADDWSPFWLNFVFLGLATPVQF